MSEPKLSPRDEAALLLAQGYSTDKAGERVGVSGSTVRRWRQEDPKFLTTVQKARAEMLEDASGMLAAGARKAVATLLREMDGEKAADRIRAALGFLSQIPPIADHALLEAKVAALEAGEVDS
jgi:transposase